MADGPVGDALVDLERPANGVVTLWLNRPQARNPLSRAMMTALQAKLDELDEDTTVFAIILAGRGPAFCAGHDLKEMRAQHDRPSHMEVFQQCSRLMQTIVHHRKIIIGRVHGIATAAGCQLVASCDLAVASDEARFATPGVNLGLFCSTPMVALSRAVGRKHTMEMLLTGEMMDANTAYRFGLVNRVVPADLLDNAVLNLAKRIASKSPKALKVGKEAFYRQAEMPLSDAYAYTAEVMTENMMADDAQEGIDAFLQKRSPVWTGQ